MAFKSFKSNQPNKGPKKNAPKSFYHDDDHGRPTAKLRLSGKETRPEKSGKNKWKAHEFSDPDEE
ncbi:MAG: hypothetical protein MUC97_05705 [Bernardetiaceae bacterium]|jgi:hypothetical protein|nr:hypothetical protein [Bernardetiaceae bacterium]